MSLEAQLGELERLGLSLNPGITVDDLLYSFGREDYESEPFDLLLFMLGAEVEREPWGRQFSSRAWNFDTECINGSGDYSEIVKNLCSVAGKPTCLSDVEDHIDFESGRGWVRYAKDGENRTWDVEVSDDWVDPMVLAYIMSDIEDDNRRFFAKDNGQAMVLYFLTNEAAAELNRLSGGALEPVVPQ